LLEGGGGAGAVEVKEDEKQAAGPEGEAEEDDGDLDPAGGFPIPAVATFAVSPVGRSGRGGVARPGWGGGVWHRGDVDMAEGWGRVLLGG
jgi:hypothetical protein